jgi:hypothetical protein
MRGGGITSPKGELTCKTGETQEAGDVWNVEYQGHLEKPTTTVFSTVQDRYG